MNENHEGEIMITCHIIFPEILSVKIKGSVITWGGKYFTMKGNKWRQGRKLADGF